MRQYSALAVILAAAPLCAGVRIQMEETDVRSGKTTTQEMLVDTNRFRVNRDANNSVLFLTDGGRSRMVMLDKAKKEYREMDEAMMKQMGQQMSGAMSELQKKLEALPPEQRAMMEKMMKGKMGSMAQPPARVPTVYTAKGSAEVNGFDCRNYDGIRAGQKVAEVCAADPSALNFTASDIRVFDSMREFVSDMMEALSNSPFGGAASSGFAEVAERGYEGFPVRQTRFANGQATTRTELKQAERTSFTDADFSLGDAKKVAMPTMPGAR